MLDQIVHSFVAFLVILDPVGVAVIFAGMTPGASEEFRRRTAWQATIIASVLVLVFGLLGEALLGALGVSMPAFRIAGGILLFLLATDMIFARPSGIRKPTGPEQEEAARQSDISVFPLAFPLLAGPGALTSVVLSVSRAREPLEFAGIIASLAVVLALTLLALLSANRVAKLLGITGANVIGRVLGIILAAMAAQYVLDGILQVTGRGG
jgi:multiple antibiotic resistance protein